MGQPEKECERLREEIALLRQRLTELTPPLEALLKRRGFTVYKKEPAEDLLVPREKYIDSYYQTMKRYSFRLFLRDIIKHQDGFTRQDVTRYATAEVTEEYTDYLLKIGLIEEVSGGYRLRKRPIKSFGETLEWFVAEILKREFRMETIWGIRFRGRRVGGDYDLIAKLDSGLLYMEVKSSPPRQIYASEISAFWSRTWDLCPDMAVFLMDTHLRMKDKLVVMFEEELRNRFENPPQVRRLKAELFTIEDRVFIINSKPSIEGNIETLLSYYLRRRCL
ncbi:hypothetical protein BMS3Bbin07_00921 [bacterium BMS3Bbin07]|nr:hypothetical protein BMS3Bbin07_00921 [bacterium BMS3Bbin07]